jgi:HEAT repeat protein
MKAIYQRLLILGAVFAIALPLLAEPKNETELLSALDSPKDKVVVSALQDFEKSFPNSEAGLAKVKALLTDARPTVHRKAARVLGALHANVSDADLKNIAALLEAKTKEEVMDGLKALRGLKAQSIAPQLVPLLQNADQNIKRDACRTLAVIGDKSQIKDIEPLLQSSEKAVVEDASKAIFALKNK